MASATSLPKASYPQPSPSFTTPTSCSSIPISRPRPTPLLLENILPPNPSAVPIEQFKLDPKFFNQALYTRIISFWFSNLTASSTAADAEAMRKWLRHGASEAQVVAFDKQCIQKFGPVIESIGPSRISLPPFKSYAEDREVLSERLAAPFLREVRNAHMPARKAADTLLALVILLDQIPRNMYRTPKGLKAVYGHYDRMAMALLHAGLHLGMPRSTVDCESVSENVSCEAYRMVYLSWLFVPLLHAEDLEAQMLLEELWRESKADMVARGDLAGAKFADNRLNAARRHLVIIYRFGRFPHRNEGLGRECTAEEVEWLKCGGETFGVKQVQLKSKL